MNSYPAIKAIKQFTEAVKLLKFSDQFEAYMERGICYREIEEIDNSIEDFIKACDIKKEDPRPHFHLGINYLLIDSYDSALQQLSTAIQLDKTQPQFYNYKALALFMTGQFDHSLALFSEALNLYQLNNNINAEVGECWFNRGNVLLTLGRCQ